MAFPGEIAKQIVGYLAPCDLARMAQVNKEWKQIVYSNSCWDLNKLWEVKPDSRTEFYSGLEIPSNARHLGGEPSLVCFQDWFSLVRKNMYHSTVPFCILESDDFSTYEKYFKKIWIGLGRPCIHTTHYKWYDVYRGREFLRKLSSADQQRIFYKHCRFVVERRIVDTNPYVFWLQNHIEFSIGYNYTLSSNETAPKSDHPADVIAAAVRNKEHKRLMYIKKCRESVFENFQTSIHKLRMYSKKEFDKKDLVWSGLFPETVKEEAVEP